MTSSKVSGVCTGCISGTAVTGAAALVRTIWSSDERRSIPGVLFVHEGKHMFRLAAVTLLTAAVAHDAGAWIYGCIV